MTSIAVDYPTAWLPAAQDRGVSQTTSVWEGAVGKAFRVSPSMAGVVLADLLQAIDVVAEEASHSNWDGEGALPVEGATHAFAKLFAATLPTGTASPEVSVDRDGDISFEWYFGPQRVFSVSVRRDGNLHYAGLFGPNKSHGSEVLLRGIPEPIAQGIRRAEFGY